MSALLAAFGAAGWFFAGVVFASLFWASKLVMVREFWVRQWRQTYEAFSELRWHALTKLPKNEWSEVERITRKADRS